MKLIKKKEKKGAKVKEETVQYSRGEIDFKISEYFDLKVMHKELSKEIKDLRKVIEDYMKINNLDTLESNFGTLELNLKLSN